MQAPRNLRPLTLPLVFLMVVMSTGGNLLLSKGMKHIGAVSVGSASEAAAAFRSTVTSGIIWFGIACLLGFFVLYLVVLSWADYSFVQPASASGYALVPLMGYLLLGEQVSQQRWLGVTVICVGVFLIGRTPARTTKA